MINVSVMRKIAAAVFSFSAVMAFAQTPARARKVTFHEFTKAPEKAVQKQNPLIHDPEAVAAGQKLFALHCSECHGASAQGTRHAPALNDPAVREAPSGALFWVLTNGVVWHGMPVWSKLPEPQRWQLVTYIKSLH